MNFLALHADNEYVCIMLYADPSTVCMPVRTRLNDCQGDRNLSGFVVSDYDGTRSIWSMRHSTVLIALPAHPIVQTSSVLGSRGCREWFPAQGDATGRQCALRAHRNRWARSTESQLARCRRDQPACHPARELRLPLPLYSPICETSSH